MNRLTFLAGGTATDDPRAFNPIDETPQLVLAEQTYGSHTVHYAALHNEGNDTAHVKLFFGRKRWTALFGGVIANGAYVITFTGGPLAAPVPVTVTRAAGVPADEAALAAAMEVAIEALIATTLAGVIVNADDPTAGTNNILAAHGVKGVTVTSSAPAGATITIADAPPDLDLDVADILVTIPAATTIPIFLGNVPVPWLYVAASTEDGVGNTAPNGDVVGTIYVD